MLRSGGRLIASAWGKEGRNPCKEAAVEVRRRYLEDRGVKSGGRFREDSWEEVERACEHLARASFKDVRARSVPIAARYRNHDEAIETALAPPITRYRLSRLPLGDRRSLAQEMASTIRAIDDVSRRAEIHCYVATKDAASVVF